MGSPELTHALSDSYALSKCFNSSCSYPLNSMQPNLLQTSSQIVTITSPLGDAYSVVTVKMIAKDATGLYSPTTVELDLIACPLATYFTPGREPLCQSVTVCKPGTHASAPPDPHYDTTCVKDTTTTMYSKINIGVDNAANSNDDIDDESTGLIVGLSCLFLCLACSIAVAIVLRKKQQDTKQFSADGISIAMQNMPPSVSNPMYLVNQQGQQGDQPTAYSVPFADGSETTVTHQQDGATYAIPVDGSPDYSAATSSPGGVNNPMYAVPMASTRVLISMKQAEGMYGRPGQDIAGVTDSNADELYGCVEASDMHSQPPWLFPDKLSRDAAEDLIARHGNRKGMFLVCVLAACYLSTLPTARYAEFAVFVLCYVSQRSRVCGSNLTRLFVCAWL